MENCQNKKFRLRVMFKKTPEVSGLSHLELARSLEKNVRRAELKYCITNGFSPHMKISFGRALNVGVACENEIFDLYLNEYISPDKALFSLQNSQNIYLPITDCWYVENNSIAASSTYIGADYIAVVDIGDINKSLIKIPNNINVEKGDKSKQIDVQKFFNGSLKIDKGSKDINKTKIRFSLKVIEGASIKPELFINSIFNNTPYQDTKILYITKKNIFNFSRTKVL